MTTSKTVATWCLWLLPWTAGCGLKQQGGFDTQGYVHAGYGYRVLAEGGALLGPEWQLDNFYERQGQLVQKDGNEYLTIFSFDSNGDGTYDEEEKAYLYDLRYKHKQRDALIWLRTMPVSNDLREKDLRVLMQQYVDEVAGAGYEAVRIRPGTVILSEKRFAAAFVDRGTARLADLDAYVATVDVANIDQIRLNPGQYSTRVRLVLVRPPFVYKWSSTHPNGEPVSQEYPVLLLAGYANLPEDFEKDLPSFTQFLNRIRIKDRSGFDKLALDPVSRGETAKTEANEPAPPAAAAEATPAASDPAPKEVSPAEP